MVNRIFLSLMAVCLFLVPQTAQAHDVFTDVLKEEYNLKSFSCKTCHAEKDKKLRTPFAERVYVELKQFGYTAKFEAAQKADEAAKAKDPESVGKDKGAVYELEKVMAVEFKKAFVKVSKQSMTIEEMLRGGLLYGARLDPKKVAAAAAAKAAAGGAMPTENSKSPSEGSSAGDGVGGAKKE